MRKPYYHPDHRNFRICSRPNNTWVFQQLKSAARSKVYDNWVDQARPTDQTTALNQMVTRAPRIINEDTLKAQRAAAVQAELHQVKELLAA